MFQFYRALFVIVMSVCSCVLHGASYDSDLLNTYSKLSPRFVLMSSQKSKSDLDIKICLVHNQEDEKSAQEFIDLSDMNYPDGIKEYKLSFVKTSYESFETCRSSALLFLFDIDSDTLKKVVTFSLKYQIMTISYNPDYLLEGVDISLFVGREIKPYLNPKSIFSKDIHLDNILLRISKIYKIDEESQR